MPIIDQDPNQDMFASEAHSLVNTINCVGTMGKGIALEFSRRFPKMLKSYQKACRANEIKPGVMWVWHEPTDERWIINFPTKDHWRNPSRLEWITAGLDDLRKHVIMMRLQSVALPALGCGNGGLDFNVVRELIHSKLGDMDAVIELYPPR